MLEICGIVDFVPLAQFSFLHHRESEERQRLCLVRGVPDQREQWQAH